MPSLALPCGCSIQSQAAAGAVSCPKTTMHVSSVFNQNAQLSCCSPVTRDIACIDTYACNRPSNFITAFLDPRDCFQALSELSCATAWTHLWYLTRFCPVTVAGPARSPVLPSDCVPPLSLIFTPVLPSHFSHPALPSDCVQTISVKLMLNQLASAGGQLQRRLYCSTDVLRPGLRSANSTSRGPRHVVTRCIVAWS